MPDSRRQSCSTTDQKTRNLHLNCSCALGDNITLSNFSERQSSPFKHTLTSTRAVGPYVITFPWKPHPTHTYSTVIPFQKAGNNAVGCIWEDEQDSLLEVTHNWLQGALSPIFNAFLTFSCCWSSLFNLASTALASLFFRIAVWIALFCLEDCLPDR